MLFGVCLGMSMCIVMLWLLVWLYNSCYFLFNMVDMWFYEIFGVSLNVNDIEIKKVSWKVILEFEKFF